MPDCQNSGMLRSSRLSRVDSPPLGLGRLGSTGYLEDTKRLKRVPSALDLESPRRRQQEELKEQTGVNCQQPSQSSQGCRAPHQRPLCSLAKSILSVDAFAAKFHSDQDNFPKLLCTDNCGLDRIQKRRSTTSAAADRTPTARQLCGSHWILTISREVSGAKSQEEISLTTWMLTVASCDVEDEVDNPSEIERKETTLGRKRKQSRVHRELKKKKKKKKNIRKTTKNNIRRDNGERR